MSGVPVERLPDEADEIAGHIRRGEVYTAHLDALGERILPGLAAEIRRLRGELGTVLGQLATVKEGYDAQALTERQRLARALADRNDEYETLRAEFDQFAEVALWRQLLAQIGRSERDGGEAINDETRSGS